MCIRKLCKVEAYPKVVRLRRFAFLRAVEALMINHFGYTIPESKAADTRIYMDDRTFVDSDLRRALDRFMLVSGAA